MYGGPRGGMNSSLVLNDYIAVPGKIIPVPGTDYVVIAPDMEAKPLTSMSSEMSLPSSLTPPDDVPPSPSQYLPHIASQTRRRGRPSGAVAPCQCPNCQEMPNVDRHICHFANCGKTFTKKNHLEAHIRNHMGSRPYYCTFPSCGASFIRVDELKRHHWSHTEDQRFTCDWCNKKFTRHDQFKLHISKCSNALGYLQSLEDADDPLTVNQDHM